MKRILMVMFIFIILFCCSCQPTPEADIIINKNDDYQENSEDQWDKTAQFSAPKEWTDTYNYFDGKVIVNINANVVIPQVESFNTYKIIPIEYSQSDAENMIRVFLDDVEVTTVGQQWTKSQLEELLIRFKASYAIGNSPNMTQEVYEKSVKDLEERIANAPETFVELDPIKQIKDFFKSGHINLQAELGKDEKASLNIVNSEEGYGSYTGFFNNNGQNYGAVPMGNCSVELNNSQEEAQKQATDLLKELNIDYMEMTAVKVGFAYGQEGDSLDGIPQCYLLFFTRSIDGISTTYDDRGGGCLGFRSI